jgi:hypothetical protein
MYALKNRTRLSIILVAVPLLSAFSLAMVHAQGILEEMEGRYKLIYDSTYIWPDGKGGYEYRRKFVSEVALAEKGRSALSRPATPILDRDDRIDISAYTRLASGEIFNADTSDIITRDLPGARRWIFVNFRQAEPGATLHLEWLLTSDEANIAGKRFLGRTVPVDSAVIIITVPQTWVFNFAVSPEINVEKGSKTIPLAEAPPRVNYSWIARNLPGLGKEEFAPPVERMIPCLYFSFYYDNAWPEPRVNKVDWKYLSQLYSAQLTGFAKSNSSLNAVGDSLRGLSSKPDELVRMANIWLEHHFRSLYSEITMTNDINEALQRGRGTQAEAAAILKTLLDKLNIPSAIYLVATHDAGDPLPNLPALFWFDRLSVAAFAANDTIWMDPYYPISEMGILPFEEQGATALSVTEPGEAFITIPISDYHENGKAIHLKLAFDSTGSIYGEATEVYTGAMIPEISSLMNDLDKTELKVPWEKRLAKSFPGVKIRAFVVMPPDSTGQGFRIGYSFTTGPIIRPFANRAYLPMDLLGRWADLPALPSKTPVFPIELRRPRFELERITVKISPPFEVEYVPDNYSDNTYIGEIYSVTRGDLHSITITRGFGLKKSTLPPSSHGPLREFLNKARAEADKHIILKRVS